MENFILPILRSSIELTANTIKEAQKQCTAIARNSMELQNCQFSLSKSWVRWRGLLLVQYRTGHGLTTKFVNRLKGTVSQDV